MLHIVVLLRCWSWFCLGNRWVCWGRRLRGFPASLWRHASLDVEKWTSTDSRREVGREENCGSRKMHSEDRAWEKRMRGNFSSELGFLVSLLQCWLHLFCGQQLKLAKKFLVANGIFFKILHVQYLSSTSSIGRIQYNKTHL